MLGQNIYDEINVSRDILDFKFVMKSGEDTSNIKYNLIIKDWSEQKLEFFINFTSPLSVSQGRNKDAIICKLKNPNLFVSKETGQTLSLEKLESAQTIPR